METINRTIQNVNGALFINGAIFEEDGAFTVYCSFLDGVTSKYKAFTVTSVMHNDGLKILSKKLPEWFTDVGNTKQAITCVFNKIHNNLTIYPNDIYNQPFIYCR
jgi:hypothetical protein